MEILKRRENFTRAHGALYELFVSILRTELSNRIPPANIQQKINLMSKNEVSKLKFDEAQRRNIERAAYSRSYNEFDISLLHKLLLNVCKIDGALKQDVEQIRKLRNKYGHMHINEETKSNFMETWKKYEDICRRMDSRTPNQRYLRTLNQLREREAVILANAGDEEGECSSEKVLSQTAFFLNLWREENQKFYITKGCKKATKLIGDISIVTITGDQGSGKSAIAHHIALKFQNKGWNVIPIQDIRKMEDHIDFTNSSKQFFVLDDPIGRETISQNCVKDWEKLENTLEKFTGKDSFRVVITCRKQILKELNVGSLMLASLVSLDGDLQLSNKEKEGILKKHVTSNCLKDDEIRAIVLKSSKYFPLLCSIFGGHEEFKKEGVKFFSEPGVIIANELRDYRDADKKKWCALFLLVSNQGMCYREINWDKQTFDHACELCELPPSTPQRTILEQYNILCGHLLKEEGSLVKFISEYVMDITTFVFFKEFPDELIKTCPLQFLCRRVFFLDCISQEEVPEYSILPNETTVDFFTDRLLSSLNSNCVEICLCTALRSPMVKHSIQKKLRLMKVKEFEATFLSLVTNKQKSETNEVQSNQNLQEVIQGTMQKLFPNLRSDLPTWKSEEIAVLDIDLDYPVTEVKRDNCTLCGITELYERDTKDREETLNAIQGKRIDETFGVKDILINIINNLIPKDSFQEIFSAFIGIIGECFETPNIIESFGAAWPKFENKLREILIDDVAFMKHIEFLKAKDIDIFDCNTLKQSLLNICNYGHFDLLQEFLKCLLERKASAFFTLVLDFVMDFSSKLSDDERCTFWKICATAYTTFRHVIAHVFAKFSKLASNNMFLKIPTKEYIASHIEIILHELFKRQSCSWMFVLPSDWFFVLAFQHRNQQCDSKHLKMDMAFFSSEISAFECFGLFGHSEIFEAIFSRLYDLQQENSFIVSRKMFLAACAAGDLDIVKRIYALMGKSAKLQRWWFGQNSYDALQISSVLHHHKIVSFLLQNEFDANIVDIFGTSPLLLTLQYMKNDATENEKLIVISILKSLIQYKANIFHCNCEGYSALHIACKFNFPETVELFMLPESIEKTSENGDTPLIIAAEKGHSNIVNILLQRGANVNCRNSEYCSPLFVSTQKGHVETMRLLLENGANIDLPNKDKMSPLSIASREGHFYAVELLLQNKANVYQRDNTGNTPALWAAYGGHKHCLQTLMYCGSSLNDWNDMGENLLFLSIKRNNLDMTKMLIQEGADMEKSTTYGMRPLHIAVLREEISVTRLLLQNGAIVNSLKGEDLPALHIAARNGNEEMAELLLSYHADINEKDKNGCTAIQAVTLVKNENIISLLSGRSDISLENSKGENVLHIAARKGFKSLTGYIINRNLDINRRNKFGETPLFLASAYRHNDVVQQLIDNGADVNFGDENNMSPLYIASQKGYKNIVLTLLKNEARFEMCRMDEVTPLMAASANGHTETAKCLLDYEQNITYINQQDCEGRTALWHAAANGYVEVVKTLLVYYLIDINKPDRYLVRPIMIASAHKHSKVVISLLKHGAILKSVRMIHVTECNTVDVFRFRNQTMKFEIPL